MTPHRQKKKERKISVTSRFSSLSQPQKTLTQKLKRKEKGKEKIKKLNVPTHNVPNLHHFSYSLALLFAFFSLCLCLPGLDFMTFEFGFFLAFSLKVARICRTINSSKKQQKKTQKKIDKKVFFFTQT